MNENVTLSSLELRSTFPADNLPRKCKKVLVLSNTCFDAFFLAPLLHYCCRLVKNLMTDDWLMVIFAKVHILFPLIVVTIKIIIRVSLLKDYISGVLFILQNSSYRC